MKIAEITLMALSLFAGLYAAFLWWEASKSKTTSDWRLKMPSDHKKDSFRDVAQENIMGWVVGIMEANCRANVLNQKAAKWTAIAVGTQAATGILALFTSV